MNFNDKFLNVCFKAGKILFSVLLVLALIGTIVLLCNAGIKTAKYNNIKLSYHYFTNMYFIFENRYSDLFGNIELDEFFGFGDKKTEKNEDNEEELSKDMKTALSLLEKFAEEEQLSRDFVFDNFKLPNDDKEKILYVKAFKIYYHEYVARFSRLLTIKRNFNDKQLAAFLKEQKQGLFLEVQEIFIEEFNAEIEKVEQEKKYAAIDKNSSYISFAVSLLIFVLFLFLPLLIRIEENTRK